MPASSRRTAAALTACLLVGTTLPATSHAAKDDLVLVSLPSLLSDPPSAQASTAASVSSDGRVVAFQSDGDSLSPDDNNSVTNIFVRNVDTNVTTLVSRQTGTTASSPGANASSDSPVVSGDGRYVAFISRATNLAADDASAADADVFVRDTVTNTTTLISRETGSAGLPGSSDSDAPAFSRNGRFVAFASTADNLSPDDNNAVVNIFVRDVATNTTALVNRGAAGPADASSFEPAISADGRYVAFTSRADNLSTEDDKTVDDVFIRDLAAGTTTLISRAPGPAGTVADKYADRPSISDDGRQVAFYTQARLTTDDVGTALDVFVRNWETATTTLASASAGVTGIAGPDDSFDPMISGDGRYVAFASNVDGLSTEDSNDVENVFVRDLTLQTTTFVSRNTGASGAASTGGSRFPAISRDGRYVAFQSVGAGLSTIDHDPTVDVFLRDVLGDPLPVTTAPVEPQPSAAATAGTPITAAKIKLSSLLTAPSTKRCLSKRKLTLRLKHANQITQLTVKVSGRKKTTTVRGSKLRAAINLTGLPRGRYTVTVTATLRDGTTQKVTRTYRTCTPKKR